MHLVEYLQYAPAGCSFKQLIHYAMCAQNPGINSAIGFYCKIHCIKTGFPHNFAIKRPHKKNYFPLTGHFRPYDYGIIKNMLVYRRFVPPEYPVEKITAPVMLFNGLSDVLAAPNVIRRVIN